MCVQYGFIPLSPSFDCAPLPPSDQHQCTSTLTPAALFPLYLSRYMSPVAGLRPNEVVDRSRGHARFVYLCVWWEGGGGAASMAIAAVPQRHPRHRLSAKPDELSCRPGVIYLNCSAFDWMLRKCQRSSSSKYQFGLNALLREQQTHLFKRQPCSFG